MRFAAITVDRLYRWLGLFTDFYFLALAFEFFSNLHLAYPLFEKVLDTFAEPYLGTLAVYVVLKEIRKRRSGAAPRHRGEWFVIVWLLLLAATTAAVGLTERYQFDTAYKLVIENSIASLMIYIGSRIHRP